MKTALLNTFPTGNISTRAGVPYLDQRILTGETGSLGRYTVTFGSVEASTSIGLSLPHTLPIPRTAGNFEVDNSPGMNLNTCSYLYTTPLIVKSLLRRGSRNCLARRSDSDVDAALSSKALACVIVPSRAFTLTRHVINSTSPPRHMDHPQCTTVYDNTCDTFCTLRWVTLARHVPRHRASFLTTSHRSSRVISWKWLQLAKGCMPSLQDCTPHMNAYRP